MPLAHVAVFSTGVQIIQVEDIPYTVNMKRVEVPVKKVTCFFPHPPPHRRRGCGDSATALFRALFELQCIENVDAERIWSRSSMGHQ